MELYQIKTFIAVAEEQTLTRAAERLFTSQPAVSAHIKALEEELGITLFDRSSRGTTITLSGSQLLVQARQTLSNVEQINTLARQLQSHPSGNLRVGAILDGDNHPLDAIAQTLQRDHPGIRLEFIHSSSGSISKGLINRDLDVGFHEGKIESPLLTGCTVGETEIVLVGAPTYQSVFDSGNWQDMQKLPWIFKTPECSYHQRMVQICQANELTLNQRYVIDHEATCLQFVRSGSAIAVVNLNSVRTDLEDGRLIAWDGFRDTLDVQLLCLSKRTEDRSIEAFFQATKNTLQLHDNTLA